MRQKDKSKQIEEAVFDCLNELSDELSINLPFYPEVVWLGRKPKFSQLLLPKQLMPEIMENWKEHRSCYLVDSKIILICNGQSRHSILEESAHAFHFINSGLSYTGRNLKERIVLRSIVEMLGFLGARILGSDLQNPFLGFPDFSRLTKESQLEAARIIKKRLGYDFDFIDFFIYQQGYGLADLIYFEYLSGRINKSQLRRLFLNKINGRGGALAVFSWLKRRFWPASLKQAQNNQLAFLY